MPDMNNKDLNTAIMLIKAKTNMIKTVFESLKHISGIKAATITMGPYDCVCFLEANGWDNLFEIIKSIRELNGLKSTVSLPVHRNFGKLSAKLSAIILTRLMRGDVDEMAERLYNSSETINYSASVAGPYDIVMSMNPALIRTPAELRQKLLEEIRVFEEIKDTVTLVAGPYYYASSGS